MGIRQFEIWQNNDADSTHQKRKKKAQGAWLLQKGNLTYSTEAS